MSYTFQQSIDSFCEWYDESDAVSFFWMACAVFLPPMHFSQFPLDPSESDDNSEMPGHDPHTHWLHFSDVLPSERYDF